MNKLALITAALLTAGTFGAAAIAQDNATGDFDKVDANKDQLVSWDEALGAFPTLSKDLFNQADANADGSLDASEFIALQGLTAGAGDVGSTSPSEVSSEASSAQ